MQKIIIIILATIFFGGMCLWHYISRKRLAANEVIVPVTTLESSSDEKVSIPSDTESIAKLFSLPIGGLWARVWDFAFQFMGFIVCEQERLTFVQHLYEIDHAQNWYYNINKIVEALQSCPSTNWQQVCDFNQILFDTTLKRIKDSDADHPVHCNICVWWAFSSVMKVQLKKSGHMIETPKT